MGAGASVGDSDSDSDNSSCHGEFEVVNEDEENHYVQSLDQIRILNESDEPRAVAEFSGILVDLLQLGIKLPENILRLNEAALDYLIFPNVTTPTLVYDYSQRILLGQETESMEEVEKLKCIYQNISTYIRTQTREASIATQAREQSSRELDESSSIQYSNVQKIYDQPDVDVSDIFVGSV